MIELPETYVLAEQAKQILLGKTIKSAVANHHPHGFAWYAGDPALYNEKLAGKKITGSAAYGGRPEIWAEEMRISFNDGVRARYLAPGEKRPEKHQLLIEFDDGSAVSCSVQMYGGMFAFENGSADDWYYTAAKEKPSPYTDTFDEAYFGGLRRGVKQTLSVKAFLATEQRIPGFGNGVLHDVLWNARLHPKRKLDTLSDADMDALFKSVKATLAEMRDGGGRDTERDLFGSPGGYRTILSSKTLAYPCPVCGGGLKREAYMGGNIYVCPACQPLN
ncbi:MAG: endonuclease VIII [Oscillospiraceae bacterium]|jgi:formamidopyrimidine-DNA glycosylase|nr:endonuclease VIII [Oscillospiraceae bacterium]